MVDDVPTRWSVIRPMVATVAAAALPLAGVTVLAMQGEPIAQWLDRQSIVVAAGVVVVSAAIACGLALLPTHAVSLACGWLFGAIAGPAIAWLAVIAALVGGFAVGRWVGGAGLTDRLDQRAAAGSRLATVHHALLTASPSRSAWIVGLVRLTPVAPFAATNVALAGLGVSWRPMLLGSAVGLIPRIAVVAWLDTGMAQLDWSKPQSPLLIGLGIAATLATLVLIGRIAQRALSSSASNTMASPA